MERFDWPTFLQEYNAEILASDSLKESLEVAEDDDLAGAVQRGWLGYPGATEDQLRQTDDRLGTTLPPSYRAFLLVSNGWRLPGTFVPRLRSTDELEWF